MYKWCSSVGILTRIFINNKSINLLRSIKLNFNVWNFATLLSIYKIWGSIFASTLHCQLINQNLYYLRTIFLMPYRMSLKIDFKKIHNIKTPKITFIYVKYEKQITCKSNKNIITLCFFLYKLIFIFLYKNTVLKINIIK